MILFLTLVAFAVLGGLAGWVGGLLVEDGGLGPCGNVVAGASMGAVLISLIGPFAPGALGTLLVVAVVAAALLLVVGVIRRKAIAS